MSPAPPARCGPPTPLAARSNPELENHMSPIECARCQGTAGPFAKRPEGPVCEDCLNEQDNQR